MLALLKMVRRMSVFGRVTAPYVPALQAHAEMYPAVSSLDAVLAYVSAWGGNPDLFKVCTLRRHLEPLLLEWMSLREGAGQKWQATTASTLYSDVNLNRNDCSQREEN